MKTRLQQPRATVRWERCIQCDREWPFPAGPSPATDGFYCHPCLNAEYARLRRETISAREDCHE